MRTLSTRGPIDGADGVDEDDFDEEEEVFTYETARPDGANGGGGDDVNHDDEEEDEAFVYPVSSNQEVVNGHHAPSAADESARPSQEDEDAPPATDAPRQPPPAIDYERLHQLCISGTLESLQQFFQQTTDSGVSSFALANEANPSSGLMPIHYAAKQGRLDVLKWLVEDVGALVEIEDREGEVRRSTR